tara:strand:- start:1595 stop:1852 length:258 start_codon:yes stop_codon:yes gene_type:complete
VEEFMDVLNYQRIVLQEKFGKKKQEKKGVSFFNKVVVVIVLFSLLYIFFSLLFPNTDAQVLTKAAPLINDLGIISSNLGGNLSYG